MFVFCACVCAVFVSCLTVFDSAHAQVDDEPEPAKEEAAAEESAEPAKDEL